MINKITSLFLAGGILFLSSCASIVSKGKYPISINSTPSQAKIVITNKKGTEIYAGNTPANLKLKAGSGFFGKAHYQVKFTKDGYDSKTVPVNFKLDGWYFGNILIGGLVGMLIVDPATGSMYKLETEFLNETLSKSYASIDKAEIKILEINDIPTEWNHHLVIVSK